MPIREAVSAGLARRERHDEEGCDPYWELTNPDLFGNFEWIDVKHIRRIDIIGNTAGYTRYRTAEGIAAGSTVADLRRAYGSRLTRLLPYPEDASGYPLPFAVTTDAGSIIFNTNPRSQKPVTDKTKGAYMSVVGPPRDRNYGI